MELCAEQGRSLTPVWRFCLCEPILWGLQSLPVKCPFPSSFSPVHCLWTFISTSCTSTAEAVGQRPPHAGGRMGHSGGSPFCSDSAFTDLSTTTKGGNVSPLGTNRLCPKDSEDPPAL